MTPEPQDADTEVIDMTEFILAPADDDRESVLELHRLLDDGCPIHVAERCEAIDR